MLDKEMVDKIKNILEDNYFENDYTAYAPNL